MTPTMRDIVQNNKAVFNRFREGQFYYRVTLEQTNQSQEGYQTFEFNIPIEDTVGITLANEEKAITLMKWIRKSREAGTFVKI